MIGAREVGRGDQADVLDVLTAAFESDDEARLVVLEEPVTHLPHGETAADQLVGGHDLPRRQTPATVEAKTQGRSSQDRAQVIAQRKTHKSRQRDPTDR